ncbi:DUF6624 domain-containing protein [Winogradskyella sediminis]|uniref:DUF6624 domain-containing protein n=1 Tax=Winogradskyella sediminis TaxID=1382466 RepID=UPI000E286818|nr:DUF6624 domain-containing protein [Winogradskyella sediminis]REG89407.1 hypothetical protein C8N41_101648 [Winogradskyella sediminis]
MKYIFIISLVIVVGCTNSSKPKKASIKKESPVNLIAVLDTIWKAEQLPIRLRDSIGRTQGFESEAFKTQNEIYHKNHDINETKVMQILDSMGWPSKKIIGEQGNLTICNVLQHSSLEVREKYLPLMRKAVKDKELSARFLVRAVDRIATDKNELQIYGGQMKYYPETKSFNFWPIKDPKNLEKRRAEMGMETISEFLKRKRVDLEWNLEEQIKRTEAFKLAKQNGNK